MSAFDHSLEEIQRRAQLREAEATRQHDFSLEFNNHETDVPVNFEAWFRLYIFGHNDPGAPDGNLFRPLPGQGNLIDPDRRIQGQGPLLQGYGP